MKRRLFLAGAVALAGFPAFAQAPASTDPAVTTPPTAAGPAPATSPPPAPAPKPKGLVRVSLTTSYGVIVLELNKAKAPITTANFLRYVEEGRMDHGSFYRANHPPGVTDFGLLQGGLQNDPKWLLKPIAHESTLKTGLAHTDGAISMGRRAPGTATSDFFICVGDQKYLDADPKAKGDNAGYAVFGYVVEGMDVVKKMLALPTSPTAGVGVMKGSMLMRSVPIKARKLG